MAGGDRVLVNAADTWTGESFTVSASDEYDAVVELGGQVGLELEDDVRDRTTSETHGPRRDRSTSIRAEAEAVLQSNHRR